MRYAILSIGNGIAMPEAFTVEIPDAHFDELDRAVGVRIKFVDCVPVEAHDAASLLVIERCASVVHPRRRSVQHPIIAHCRLFGAHDDWFHGLRAAHRARSTPGGSSPRENLDRGCTILPSSVLMALRHLNKR